MSLSSSRGFLIIATVTTALLCYLSLSMKGNSPISGAPSEALRKWDLPNNALCYEKFQNNFSRAGHQTETRQVVFAKVHKAASSTVQNILLRFAMARNLSVLLPTGGPIISQSSSKIRRESIIPSIRGEKNYDILCSHVLYEEEEINKYFPKSAFRVAIIREPMKQALSALTYYTVTWAVKELKGGYDKHKTDPITGFLKHPEDFSGGKKCPQPWSYVNSRMSYDLGLNVSKLNNSKSSGTELKSSFKKLEIEFHLVLVSDLFDESMILLKRKLKWSMKDIIYIKVNQMHLDKNSVWRKKPNLTLAELQAFRHCNQIDYALYEHFLPIFLDKVEREPLFKEEVTAYKRVLKSVSEFCQNATSGEKLRVQRNRWTKEFYLWRCECDLMKKTEPSIVNIVKEKQMWLHEKYLQTNPPASASP